MQVYTVKRQHAGRAEAGRYVDGRNTQTTDETGNGKAKRQEIAKGAISVCTCEGKTAPCAECKGISNKAIKMRIHARTG